MKDRYPPLEPYDAGMLDVGDGHRVHWECSGNPHGKPGLYLHGGPGGGCTPGARRHFDPAAYRIVMFDQRGCGRSRPLASDPGADLSANTTHHLIADIEQLREHLGVERWVIFGASWGTTLALAYAHAHRERVEALVLGAVATTSRRYVTWITEDVGCIFPREWERFANAVPERLRGRRLVDAYAEWLADPDPAECDRAAIEWCAWEDAHVSLAPGHQPYERFAEPEFRLVFARLVTHYWRHAAFLDDDVLVRDAAKLDGIPGVMIHGRYDVSGPLEAAWQLARRWSTSRLVVLDEGHGGPAFGPAIVEALDEFARR